MLVEDQEELIVILQQVQQEQVVEAQEVLNLLQMQLMEQLTEAAVAVDQVVVLVKEEQV
mgnify:CR=1 FL=1